MPVDELLSAPRARHHIKRRLLNAGIKENRCEECGLAEWRGRPLSMALHHINGDGSDNRLENLQMLCPNCHSQTENFAGRNRRPRASGGASSARATLGWAPGGRRLAAPAVVRGRLLTRG